MQGDWPLVGRTAELALLGELLRSGAGGVVLAGPAGVGKTRLASEGLVLAAAGGLVPVRVAATQAAAVLPFGAFAPLLPELAAPGDRANVLQEVASAIANRGKGRRVAVMVDDAHCLDEASAALVHQLAGNPETFVLATLRSEEATSDAVIAMWKDGLVERVELAPLSLNDVDNLLTTVLGGPVDGAATRRFWERTEGNSLFLKELLMAAQEARVLQEDDGVWHLSGALPPSARLVELIEARLVGLDPADRDIIELVVLGQPIGLDLLDTDPARVDRLERRGLLRVDVAERRVDVRLAHPLQGDVLRTRLSPLRLRSLVRRLADVVAATGARRRDDLLRVATWRLEAGGPLQPEAMVAAGQRARALSDLGLAERLVRAGVDAGGGFSASLLLGKLVSDSGRAEEAEHVLEALVAQAATDAERAVLAANRIVNCAWRMGRLDAALSIAEEAERAISDPARRDEITAERIALLEIAGKTTAALELAGPFVERATGWALVRGARAATFCYGVAGRTTEALAVSERGLRTHANLEGAPRWTLSQHLAARLTALAYVGRLAEAEQLAVQEYELAVTEGWPEPHAWFAHTRAMVALGQGRMETALRWVSEALGLYRRQAAQVLGGWALAHQARALALLGRVPEADAVLAELEQWPVRTYRRAEQGISRAWVAVARGDAAAARLALEEAARTAAEGGDFTLEVVALHDLARLGQAAEVATRLVELVGTVEGPLAPLRAAHASALVSRDVAGLEAVARGFEEVGALLLAAEAEAEAALSWRKAGDPRRAAAAERRAHALAARCEGARTPALTAVSVRAALSARELEIARLAAAGVPNKEIAARLFLSIRTVENKLHAAYEKLGIDGRAELDEALESW